MTNISELVNSLRNSSLDIETQVSLPQTKVFRVINAHIRSCMKPKGNTYDPGPAKIAETWKGITGLLQKASRGITTIM